MSSVDCHQLTVSTGRQALGHSPWYGPLFRVSIFYTYPRTYCRPGPLPKTAFFPLIFRVISSHCVFFVFFCDFACWEEALNSMLNLQVKIVSLVATLLIYFIFLLFKILFLFLCFSYAFWFVCLFARENCTRLLTAKLAPPKSWNILMKKKK